MVFKGMANKGILDEYSIEGAILIREKKYYFFLAPIRKAPE